MSLKLFTVNLRCNNNGCLDFDDGELVLSQIFSAEKTTEEFNADCIAVRAEWDALVEGDEPPESDDKYFTLFEERGYSEVEVEGTWLEELT